MKLCADGFIRNYSICQYAIFHSSEPCFDPKLEVIQGHDFIFQKPMVGKMKRRSRSSDCLWLDHKPEGTVETGSILQPRIKTAKTGAKLSEKDLKDKDTSKYLLTHQSLDSDGEMATQLVKVCHFCYYHLTT